MFNTTGFKDDIYSMHEVLYLFTAIKNVFEHQGYIHYWQLHGSKSLGNLIDLSQYPDDHFHRISFLPEDILRERESDNHDIGIYPFAYIGVYKRDIDKGMPFILWDLELTDSELANFFNSLYVISYGIERID